MKKTLISLICISAASAAFAYEGDLNQHTGGYLELIGGTNAYYVGVVSSRGTASSGGVEGGAVGLGLGYHFTPLLAIEGGNFVSFFHINHGEVLDAPYVTSRFDVAIGSRVNFIAKVGLMAVIEPNEGGLVLPFTGVGFSFAATKDLELNVQYQGAFYGIAAAGVAGFGLTYHF